MFQNKSEWINRIVQKKNHLKSQMSIILTKYKVVVFFFVISMFSQEAFSMNVVHWGMV